MIFATYDLDSTVKGADTYFKSCSPDHFQIKTGELTMACLGPMYPYKEHNHWALSPLTHEYDFSHARVQ